MKNQDTKRAAGRKRGGCAEDQRPASASAGARDGDSPRKKPPERRRLRERSTRECSRPSATTAEPCEQVPAPAAEAPVKRSLLAPSSFPIVGIGASAGGLEALEQFLKHVPEHSGMAFVVVQHMDPTHKGAMVELLQRACSLQVVQVQDRQKVEPDHVYVIPPNKDMSILHGELHLMAPVLPRGFNLPIDFFFRSLAEDQQEHGIGVVLSGMGSDGTLGLRAIKEKAGAGFVQALSSAKFDGMPRSAIEAGLADVVAPAEELPAKIIAYHQHAPYVAKAETALEEKQGALEKVFILLRGQTGNDFSLYKRSTIQRRIERRMSLHQIDKVATYVRYLRENPREIELLFTELLIGVTCFFRDPPAWEHLRNDVLPELVQKRAQGGVLRAWVPGCSTGEEAYSLAIVLTEAIDQLNSKKNITLQIFATDLDKAAIERARMAIYPANIVADVSPDRLSRFFFQDDRGYRVRKEIRESVVFAPQNIITDPPFTKLDILLCRNLLIYLSPELQKKLIPLFHYSLNPGGVLFLGNSETVGTFSRLFKVLDGKSRLYRRLETTVGAPAIEFPSSFVSPSMTGARQAQPEPLDAFKVAPPHLQTLADRVIVQRFSPAAVLTSERGEILYISRRTGKYLEPPVGRASLNILAMAREGLRYELSGAFSTALKQGGAVTVRGVKVSTNGGMQTVDLTVQRLTEPKELRGTVMIVITDVAMAPQAAALPNKMRRSRMNVQLAELERELQQAREEVQTTREEMQTSQEELKSTNEELQSTNEELQSTNEELTTSKEEMQSMNEELQTVNHELQSKVDQLGRSNNDMKNLLNSTDIATLFLDGALLVRRFTTQTTKLIKLIPSDTGRPITDIATDLDYPDLAEDAREVLRTLVFKEKLVTTREGRWFAVRILPYRTLENMIDGVVITFTDVTAAKALEKTLREQASQLLQMAESLPTLVWGCHPDGACDYLSRQWVQYTGIPETEQLGYAWLERVHPDDREQFRQAWKTAVMLGTPLHIELRIRGKDGSFRWFKTRSVPIRDEEGNVVKWYGTHTDIDDVKQAAEGKQQAADRLTSILDGISDAFVALDDKLVVTYFNAAAERMLDCRRHDVLGQSFFSAFPQAKSSAFDDKIQEALQDQRALVFHAQLEPGLRRSSYGVRVYPHAHGISVFIERTGEPGRAVAPDGGGTSREEEEPDPQG